MKLRGIITGAALLQATLVGATASRPPANADVGGGWVDAMACAGCVGLGIVTMMTAGEAVAVTIIVGGTQAVTAATAVAACLTACARALD